MRTIWVSKVVASHRRVQTFLENSAHTLYSNLHEVGLDLLLQKTTLMNFPWHQKYINLSIKLENNMRFLGIIFDSQLSFSERTKRVQKRCLRSMKILKFTGGIRRRADKETLLTLYKSLVRSKIKYGLFIYYPRHKNQDKLKFGYRILASQPIFCTIRV